jgi:serine/threonine-protein kinase
MTPEQWKRVQTLFKEIVDLDPDTKSFRLEQIKTENPLLYDELLTLLAADSEPTSILDGFAADQVDLSSILQQDIKRIGPFEIDQKIGTGGMGNVYRAKRVEGGFDQTVALKLIKYGLRSEQAVSHFESERNILAGLQHPHIARLIDGGVTEEDHPWFAMEYIDGEDLLTYSSRRQLNTEDKLSLFLDVTEAVQYAHRNLVVHRDLKPNNILVTGELNKPQVKLLDFGISQVMDDTAGKESVKQAMTRAYASPEQISGDPTSTLSDIYSLGVILWQLLSNTHPKAEFSSEGSNTLTIDPELEAICLKAMMDDPSKRFETVSEMSGEILAWLHHQPVQSYASGKTYHFRKWIQRNRAASATAAFALLTLLLVIVIYTNELRIETERAQNEAETSQQIAGFLQGLFENVDPAFSRGDTLTALAMLENGRIQVEEDLQESPELLVRMYDVLGDAYISLWDTEKADELFTRSLEIKRKIYDSGHVEIGNSLHRLGNIRVQNGDFEAADTLLQQALAIRESQLEPNNADIGYTLQMLGFLNRRLANPDKAVDYYQRALSIFEAGSGDEAAMETASLKNSLGSIEDYRANYDQAITLYREALDGIRDVKGPDHPRIINYLSNLGYAYHLDGDSLNAERYLLESIDLAKQIRGETHPHTALSLSVYSNYLYDQGKLGESRDIYAEILRIYLEEFGEQHPAIPVMYNNLGNVEDNMGNYTAAEEYHRKALQGRLQLYGEMHSETAQSYANLATTLENTGRLEDSLNHFRRALSIETEVFGDIHPEVAWTNRAIGRVLQKLNRIEDAEVHNIASYEIMRDAMGEDHANTGTMKRILADFYRESGQNEKAETLESGQAAQ